MRKLLYVVMLLVAVVACQEKKRIDLTKTEQADSIFKQTALEKNYERAFALIDSFEKAGVYTSLHASKRRGDLHLFLRDFDKAEVEFRKAAEVEPQNLRDSLSYFASLGNIAQLEEKRLDYDAVLKTALPVIEELNNFKYPQKYAYDVMYTKLGLLTYVGEAQFALNKETDAEKTYEQNYQLMNEMIKERDTCTTYSACISCLDHIVAAYLDSNDYDKAEYWQKRVEKLYEEMGEVPDNIKDYMNSQKEWVLEQRMLLAIGQNKPDEAKQYYEDFKKTALGQSPEGQYRIAQYFMKANRYNGAADAYVGASDLIKMFENAPGLDHLSMLGKKYMANYKAGRKDSALAVATFAMENLDSTITRVRRSEAAKLATIFETQQKDEEIAQQQIELNRQKIFALMVAMGLITVFFIVYTIFRRRAARRLAEVKAQQERIESELRIARDIQMSMVPSVFPDREGLDMYASMTPAKEVGGDLYGYVINGHNLYFAIGDVSGKGVPASLFMAQATRLFRTMANQGLLPAEICTHMNTELSGDDNVNGMFVTMFIGMLDMESGRLQFCNAGHNPPVLGGGDNQGDFLQMEPNGPIGLWPQLEYVGEELDNIKGRALFVYTDGLNEAEDALHNQFGDERMLAILRQTRFNSARQVVETLFAKVEEHRAGAEPNDDLTMLCLRVS